MIKYIILPIIICSVGCSSNDKGISKTRPGEPISNKYAIETKETITEATKEEKEFFKKLKSENMNLLFSDSLMRTRSPNGGDLLSTVVIKNDTLLQLGYVYYEFCFVGEISNVSVSYKYSRGFADMVFGSAYGQSTAEYFHNFTAYGQTAKTISVYHNGSQVCSLSQPWSQ